MQCDKNDGGKTNHQSYSFPLTYIYTHIHTPNSTLKGAESFSTPLFYTLVLSGAATWALASFTSSTAWLSLGLATTLASGLSYLHTQTHTLPQDVILPAVLPLLVAGVVSAPVFQDLDAFFILGLCGGVVSQGGGVGEWGKTARVEVFVLVTLAMLMLLGSPGLM
jgi:hypothetical protein